MAILSAIFDYLFPVQRTRRRIRVLHFRLIDPLEEYLGNATDLADLENRIRNMHQRFSA